MKFPLSHHIMEAKGSIEMNGIDVSHYQGNIDWKKVKNNGITFAMCKASQGAKLSDAESEPFEDEKFGNHLKSAAENGIFCGAYHFLTGTTPDRVEKETDFFIKTLKKYGNLITYPCACDLEDRRYTKLSKQENSALVRVFADKVKAAGFVPMLYTNLSFYKNYLDMKMLGGIDIWFARYYAKRSPLPKPDIAGMTMFQWDDSGVVDGIPGKVDLDVCYIDYRVPEKGIQAGKNEKLQASESEELKAGDADEFKIGDSVTFRSDAETYWPSGPKIPAFAKKNFYKIIQTTSQNKEVVKCGAKCVLLEGINTWAAVETLKKFN